jgi:hypothetical protein
MLLVLGGGEDGPDGVLRCVRTLAHCGRRSMDTPAFEDMKIWRQTNGNKKKQLANMIHEKILQI